MRARRRGALAGRGLCLAAVAVLSAGTAAWARDRPPPTVTSQTLDALARQYRDAGLPLPPADAPLVLAQIDGVSTPTGDRDASYVIGFKLAQEKEEDSPDRFLMGTQRGEANNGNSQFPATRPLDAAKGFPTVKLVEGWSAGAEPFTVNNWLALAVQCHLRGYDRLAGQIFARGLVSVHNVGGLEQPPPGDGSLRDILADTAWNHWMNVLCTEGSDRREVLAHLEKLATGFSFLNGQFHRDYLASLRLAMVPGKGAPESVEGLIDALVDHTGIGGNSNNDTNDLVYLRLQNLGFEAVPALIAHLDDRRLTRSVLMPEGEGHLRPRCLHEVARALIEDIAGSGEIPENPAGRFYEALPGGEAVTLWWGEANAVGEEAYMVARKFPPNTVSLQIVADRYPGRLGEIYARMLKECPNEGCQPVLSAISECGQIRPEEKHRLIHLGIASPDLGCFLEALRPLAELDRADADAALTEKLGHWPTEATVPYSAMRPEVMVSYYVMESDSAEVWQAYERALFRATVTLRMDMLALLANGGRGTRQYVRQLALLDLLLDDEEERVIRKEDTMAGGRYEGQNLTANDRRLSVGNFVAGLLKQLVGVKPPLGKVHDARWWAKYRADVRAGIVQYERAVAEAPVPEE